MTQTMQTRPAQRTVIGRTQAGLPRTFRLARQRSLSARMLMVLKRRLP